ncbi:hypothetical protein VCHA53O466_140014 [Vibrio chagasii]|nr:hypothetical protein VCHA53O466_140014 [Vibrio chagasii]
MKYLDKITEIAFDAILESENWSALNALATTVVQMKVNSPTLSIDSLCTSSGKLKFTFNNTQYETTCNTYQDFTAVEHLQSIADDIHRGINLLIGAVEINQVNKPSSIEDIVTLDKCTTRMAKGTTTCILEALLEITHLGANSLEDSVQIIQEYLYNHVGMTGSFVVAKDKDGNWKHAVKNGSSTITIFTTQEVVTPSETVEDEITASNSDLNRFKELELGFITSIVQLDLNDNVQDDPDLTVEEYKIANNEGWGIFAVDGDFSNLQIQALSDNPKFSTDKIAWNFIINKAAGGSELHRKAIKIIKVTTPSVHERYVLDVDVIETDCSSDDIERGIEQPYAVIYANGGTIGFDTEDEACEAQLKYREAVSL